MPSPFMAEMSVHSTMRCESHATRRVKTNIMRIHAPHNESAEVDTRIARSRSVVMLFAPLDAHEVRQARLRRVAVASAEAERR